MVESRKGVFRTLLRGGGTAQLRGVTGTVPGMKTDIGVTNGEAMDGAAGAHAGWHGSWDDDHSRDDDDYQDETWDEWSHDPLAEAWKKKRDGDGARRSGGQRDHHRDGDRRPGDRAPEADGRNPLSRDLGLSTNLGLSVLGLPL